VQKWAAVVIFCTFARAEEPTTQVLLPENWQCTLSEPSAEEELTTTTNPVESLPAPAQEESPHSTAAVQANQFPPKSSSRRAIDWSFCREKAKKPSIADQPLNRSAPMDVQSDRVTLYEQNSAVFWGNVRLSHPGELLEAPWLLYDIPLETAQAQYGLRYRRGELTMVGKEAYLDLENNRGVVEGVQYSLASAHARGSADVAKIEDRTHSEYTDATYSTCPEGKEDWVLHAENLKIDQEKGKGVGRNVTTYFKGVPFLYLPYLSFPTSGKRESGFLIPSIGSSSRSGLDIRIPYYWNWAPAHDATFVTRIMTKRGMQLDSEVRYLTERSKGQVELEYLPQDQLYGKQRGMLSLQHNTTFAPHLKGEVVFAGVSDNDYFHDLGSTLNLTSLNYLERRADLTYSGNYWSGLARVQGFQTLDDGRPFARIPELSATLLPRFRIGSGESSGVAEFSYFYRDPIAGGLATNQNYTGNRIWLQPSLAYPSMGVWGFFSPRLTLNHTSYSLADTAPGLPATPQLTLPLFSVDSGLFLERPLTIFGQNLTQTLEPRLYYLYVPYKDQKNLPVFDTSLLDFGFGQLFRENRFSGPDRVGDANQLAIAATTRFLDSTTGTQFLYGSLGQILYFRDRLVTLDYGGNSLLADEEGGATSRSDVIAEVGTRLSANWTASSTVQWNQQNGQPEKRAFRVRYQSDRDKILNFSYRSRQDLLEQIDIAGVWPVRNQWHTVGRWNYSMKDAQTLESFAGIRYDNCCWALQLVARRYVNLPGEPPKGDLMLQLELKGLASVGDRLDPMLTSNIFGYQPVGYQNARAATVP